MADFADRITRGAVAGLEIAQRMQQMQHAKQQAAQDREKHDIAIAEFDRRKLFQLATIQDPKLKKAALDQFIAEKRAMGRPVDKASIEFVTNKENADQLITAMTNLSGQHATAQAKMTTAFMLQFTSIDSTIKAMEQIRSSNTKMAQAQALASVRGANLDYRQTKSAEGALNNDKMLSANVQRLDGVARINDLLKEAAAGNIVTNQQVVNLIGEEVARLELGAGALGLGQSERNTVVDTFKSQVAKLTERLTGNPQDAIPPGQLNQMTGQLDAMTKSYMLMTDRRLNTLKAGMTPIERKVADAKEQEIKSGFTDQFGYWGEKQARAKTNEAPPTPEEMDAIRKEGLDPMSGQVVAGYREWQAKQSKSQANDPIDLSRPIIKNTDGSFSTEKTITIEAAELNGGKPTNIPTIWEGEELPPKEAIKRAIRSKKSFPSFSSTEEAVSYAKKRSARIGELRQLGTQSQTRQIPTQDVTENPAIQSLAEDVSKDLSNSDEFAVEPLNAGGLEGGQ